MAKQIFTILISFFITANAWAQLSGNGTLNDPYRITDESELNEVKNHPTAHFRLMNDITLSAAWTPISDFSGYFHGGGHSIQNLWIDSNVARVGLFKTLEPNGVIDSLKIVVAGAGIKGLNYVGSLTGQNNGRIVACYATGTGNITGNTGYVGGLVGRNEGFISACYATLNATSSTIGTVGGLVGDNMGEIQSSYATGNVSGEERVGGLVGRNMDSGTKIVSCFATGTATANTNAGGLVGYNSEASISNSKYVNGVGVGNNPGSTDAVQVELSALYGLAGTSTLNNNSNWGPITRDLPYLKVFGKPAPFPNGEGTTASPFLLFNEEDLRNLAIDVNEGDPYTYIHFRLENDIILSDQSWTPIGNIASMPFNGSFHGNGHIIDSLWIDSNNSGAGLFGYTNTNAVIEKLGITLASKGIKGTSDVGGLVGYNKGKINTCYVSGTGTISGSSTNIGGLVGVSIGTISACYATIDVSSGGTIVGGLIGNNAGTIQNCYASGNISGNNSIGGLAGRNAGSGISYSFASGLPTASGGNPGGLVGYNEASINNCRFVNGVAVGTYISGNISETVQIALIQLYNTGGTTVLNDNTNWGTVVRGLPYLKVFPKPVPFPEGEGTAISPFLLYTESDLRKLATDINGGESYAETHFQLMNDISLTSAWTPIGGNGSLNEFSGHFHGAGHIIENLYINSNQDAVGFFGRTGENSTIDKLGILVASTGIIGKNDVGALVGLNYGEVSACYVGGSGNIKATTARAGALIGSMENAKVINCYATANVPSGSATQIGGLIGYMKNSSLQNSYAANSVTGASPVGGLVGHNGESSTIQKSYYNSYSNRMAVGVSDQAIAATDTVGINRADMAALGLAIMPNLSSGGQWYPGSKEGATYYYPSPIQNHQGISITVYQLKLNTDINLTYKDIYGVSGEKTTLPESIGNPPRTDCTFKDWISEKGSTYVLGDFVTLHADSTFRARWTAVLTLPEPTTFAYNGGVTAGEKTIMADSIFSFSVVPAESYRIDSIYAISTSNPNDTIYKAAYTGTANIKVTKAAKVVIKTTSAQHKVTLPTLQDGLSYILPLKAGDNPAVDSDDFVIDIQVAASRHFRNMKAGDTDITTYNDVNKTFTYIIESLDKDTIIPDIIAEEYYLVTYNTSGGTAAKTDSITHNTAIPDLNTKPITRDGCTFAYWVDKDNKEWGVNDVVLQDMTLTAKWNALVKITVTGDGGSVSFENSRTDSTTIADNVFTFKLKVGATYKIGDVKIADQTLVPNGNGEYSFTVNSNTTLTVRTIKLYAVRFNLNGGAGTTPAEQIIENGKLASGPAAPTRRGYTFDGWFKEGSNAAWKFASDLVREDMTLTAKWTLVASLAFDSDITSVPYNGAAQSTIPPYTFSGLTSPIIANLEFGYLDAEKAILSGAPTNVGEYYITATYKETGTNSLDVVLRDTTLLRITKINFPAEIVLKDSTYIYDGQEKKNTIPAEITLPAGTEVSYADNKRTVVGTSRAKATLTNSNYNTKLLEANLTITAADFPATVVFEGASFVYNGSERTITIPANLLPAGTTVVYTGNKLTNVGTSQAKATLTNSNYNTKELNATLTITQADFPATIVFEGASFVYDGSEKSITIPSNLLPAGTTVVYTGNKLTNVGTSQAKATLTNSNYKTKELNATLTITAADFPSSIVFNSATYTYDGTEKTITVSGTLPTGTNVTYENNKRTNVGTSQAKAILTNSNYKGKTLTANLIIQHAGIPGITFSNATFVYDGTAKRINISGNLPAETTVTYSNNEKINVGEYVVTATLESENYEKIELDATLTITPAEFLSTIVFEGASFVYDGNEKTITIPEGLLPEPGKTTVTYENNKRTNIGTSQAIATLRNPNYNTATRRANLEITPATFPDAVVFEGASYVYDSSKKTITIHESLLPEQGKTTVAYENNEGTDVGIYQAIATLSNPNYHTATRKADLIITPADFPATIVFEDASFVYDGNEKTITIPESLLPLATNVAYTSNTRTNTGTSHAKATLTNSNYNTKELLADLEITPADYPPTVVFAGKSFTYDGTEKTITIPENILPEGTTVVYKDNTRTNAGTSHAEAEVLNSNYNTKTLNADLIILQADFPASVVFSDISYIYDITEKEITIPGSLLPSNTSAVYENNKGTNAGTYQAKVTLTNDNYKTKILSATLTILQDNFPASVIFTGESFIYNATERVITIQESLLPPGTSVDYSDNKRTNVGTSYAIATLTNNNYKTKILEAELEITQANFPPAIILQGATFIYDGTPKTVRISGGTLPPGTGVAYADNTLTNVGTLRAKAILSNPNYFTKTLEANLTITPADFSESITFNDVVLVYNGTERIIEISGTLPTNSSIAYTSNKRTNIGTSNAKAVLTNANYKTKTLEARLIINPADFSTSIVFNNVTYTYDGAEKKIAISGTLPTGTKVDYTDNTRTNVGTSNAQAVLTNDNYNTKTLEARLTVNPANFPASITFNSATYIYDGTEKEIVVSGTLPTGTSVEYVNNKRTESGTSYAKAILTNNNYNTKTLNAELTIIKNQEIKVEITASPELVTEDAFTYVVDPNKTLTEAVFTFDLSPGSTISGEGVSGNVLKVPIHRAAENKTVEVIITSQDGSKREVIVITVKKHFKFSDIVVQKWNNVLIVNNNPAVNGGYSFISYAWYRGNVKIGDEQFHSAGDKKADLLSATEPYRVVMTTVEGVQLETHPSKIVLQKTVSVYPTMVNTNTPITVEGLNPETTNIAVIYNTQGAKIEEQVLVGETAQLDAPSVPGNYIIKVNEVTTSIVVK